MIPNLYLGNGCLTLWWMRLLISDHRCFTPKKWVATWHSNSLKLTAFPPLKIGRIPKGKACIPTIHFQGRKCHVSFRVPGSNLASWAGFREKMDVWCVLKLATKHNPLVFSYSKSSRVFPLKMSNVAFPESRCLGIHFCMPKHHLSNHEITNSYLANG